MPLLFNILIKPAKTGRSLRLAFVAYPDHVTVDDNGTTFISGIDKNPNANLQSTKTFVELSPIYGNRFRFAKITTRHGSQRPQTITGLLMGDVRITEAKNPEPVRLYTLEHAMRKHYAISKPVSATIEIIKL